MHSRYGGSVIARVLACPGYVNATRNIDDDAPNEAAEKGTAAHMLVEWCLVHGFDCIDGLGKEFNGFVVDEIMAEDSQVYVNHIRSIRINNPGKSYVEKTMYMSSVAADVWATPDHLHVCIQNRTLFVDDFKYGFLVVDEEENEQTAHCAVSALDTLGLWFGIDKVVCTIIQPRADHVRGDIRDATYTIDQLEKWRDTFKTGIEKSRDRNAERIAGEHCRYCPAAATCRARMLRTIVKCSLDAPLESVTDEEINALKREIPTILKHLEKVEEHALMLARSGKRYKDFKLVKGRVRAVCTDEEAILKAATEKGIDRAKLYNPGKLKGKSVLKPLLGQETVDKYFETPAAETKLVPLSNSATAVGNDASGVFTKVH